MIIQFLQEILALPGCVEIMGVGVAIAAAVTFAGSLIQGVGIPAALANTAITVGASLLIRELNETDIPDDLDSFSDRMRGRTENIKEPLSPRKSIYGKVRVGGSMLFAETAGNNNKFLHLILAHASHQCESIESVYLNEHKLSLDSDGFDTTNQFGDLVRVKKHLGNSDQTADSDLINEVSDWTSSHRLRNICYTYVRLEWDRETFAPVGVPTVNAIVKGKNNVFDPRDNSRSYTNNPALCIRDYIVDNHLGLQAKEYEINDESVKAAANDCDETVTNLDDTQENRYTLNGVVGTTSDHRRIISKMNSSMAGTVSYSSGQFHVSAGVFKDSGITFTSRDIISDITVQTDKPISEQFNSVRGIYVDPDQNYEPVDFDQIQPSKYIEKDGEQKWKDVELPFTTSHTMARRIGRITLRKSRNSTFLTADFNMKAYQNKVGDVVRITHDRFGWKKKAFEIVEWSLLPTNQTQGSNSEGSEGVGLKVEMTLEERPSSVYETLEEKQPSGYSTPTLRDPTDVPAPSNFSVTSDPIVFGDGTLQPRFDLSWNSPSQSFVNSGGLIQIQRKKSTDATYNETAAIVDPTTQKKYVVDDIETGVDYDFRIRSISAEKSASSWVESTNNTASGSVSSPSDASSPSATQEGELVFFSFSSSDAIDRDHYLIHVDGGTSFDESSSTKLDEHDSTRYKITESELEDQGYSGDVTFGAKTVDSSGNLSPNWQTATVSVDVGFNRELVANKIELIDQNNESETVQLAHNYQSGVCEWAQISNHNDSDAGETVALLTYNTNAGGEITSVTFEMGNTTADSISIFAEFYGIIA